MIGTTYRIDFANRVTIEQLRTLPAWVLENVACISVSSWGSVSIPPLAERDPDAPLRYEVSINDNLIVEVPGCLLSPSGVFVDRKGRLPLMYDSFLAALDALEAAVREEPVAATPVEELA